MLLSQMCSKMAESLFLHWEGGLDTGLAKGPEAALDRGITSKSGGGDTLTKVELNSLVQLGDVHPSSWLKSNCWRSGVMAVG